MASELPRKTEVALYHGLSALQKRCYKAILMKDLGNQRPPVRLSELATAARGGSVRSRSLCVAGAGDAVCVLKIVQSAAVDLASVFTVTATSPAVALGTFPPLPPPSFPRCLQLGEHFLGSQCACHFPSRSDILTRGRTSSLSQNPWEEWGGVAGRLSVLISLSFGSTTTFKEGHWEFAKE